VGISGTDRSGADLGTNIAEGVRERDTNSALPECERPHMLRITIQRGDDDLVMKLEGCLAGPWVDELERSWSQTRAQQGGRVRVDMTGVCHVDEAGRELMTRMYHAGAAYVVSGCMMPEVVREVTGGAVAAPSVRERT
jgi:hypothetical protein